MQIKPLHQAVVVIQVYNLQLRHSDIGKKEVFCRTIKGQTSAVWHQQAVTWWCDRYARTRSYEQVSSQYKIFSERRRRVTLWRTVCRSNRLEESDGCADDGSKSTQWVVRRRAASVARRRTTYDSPSQLSASRLLLDQCAFGSLSLSVSLSVWSDQKQSHLIFFRIGAIEH